LIDNEVSPENRDETGKSMTVPALGISWANFVSTRVMLEKEYELEAESGLSVVRRKMKIVFSPSLPQTQIAFEVVERGVKGLGKVTVSF
jgi:Rad51